MEKRRRVTDEELERLKHHAVLVTKILAAIARLWAAVLMARPHHAGSDGSDYPDGPTGEDIPLELRILAVAHCFDVMVADAPHGKAMTAEEAIAEIERGVGSHFDPQAVEAFLRSERRENTPWRLGN